MKQEFNVYREARRYYIEENEGLFTKEECELVDNIPQMLRHFVGSAKKMKVVAGDKPFDGATKLTLENDDVGGGVQYSMETDNGKVTGWLCSVFLHFFPVAPKELFIAVEKVE